MSSSPIASAMLLRPVVALNPWTFGMEVWMYATRIPAIAQMNPQISSTATRAVFDARTPASVRWKADNYNHLFEQPTQFYAVLLVLALARGNNELDGRLAWVYVGLRVAHSLVHVSSNKLMVRFTLFAASSLVLLGLTARATMLLF